MDRWTEGIGDPWAGTISVVDMLFYPGICIVMLNETAI